jgi:hypothetical protein
VLVIMILYATRTGDSSRMVQAGYEEVVFKQSTMLRQSQTDAGARCTCSLAVTAAYVITRDNRLVGHSRLPSFG